MYFSPLEDIERRSLDVYIKMFKVSNLVTAMYIPAEVIAYPIACSLPLNPVAHKHTTGGRRGQLPTP